MHRHPAIADIASGDDKRFDLAVRITNETAVRFQSDIGSILSSHPVFNDLANASLNSFLCGPRQQGTVVGMDVLEGIAVLQFLCGVAEQAPVCWVVINTVATLVDDGNQIGAVLGDRTEQLVGPASRFVGLFMLSNRGHEISVRLVDGSSPLEHLEFEVFVHSEYAALRFLAPNDFGHELVDYNDGNTECQQDRKNDETDGPGSDCNIFDRAPLQLLVQIISLKPDKIAPPQAILQQQRERQLNQPLPCLFRIFLVKQNIARLLVACDVVAPSLNDRIEKFALLFRVQPRLQPLETIGNSGTTLRSIDENRIDVPWVAGHNNLHVDPAISIGIGERLTSQLHPHPLGFDNFSWVRIESIHCVQTQVPYPPYEGNKDQ